MIPRDPQGGYTCCLRKIDILSHIRVYVYVHVQELFFHGKHYFNLRKHLIRVYMVNTRIEYSGVQFINHGLLFPD